MKCPKEDCKGKMELIEMKSLAYIKCNMCSMTIWFNKKEKTIKYFEENS